MLESNKVTSVRLCQPPISSYEVRQMAHQHPELVPHGTRCAHCGHESLFLIEMWPVVVTYVLHEAPHVTYEVERYAYCCSAAHASVYMLNWWDEGNGTLIVERLGR